MGYAFETSFGSRGSGTGTLYASAYAAGGSVHRLVGPRGTTAESTGSIASLTA